MERIKVSYCGSNFECGSCIEGEVCAVAKCVKSRGIRFCGECGEIPCEKLQAVEKRFGNCFLNCQAVKRELVQEAREGLDPIAYCGFSCDHCFLGQWCGGCRSGYNCCSFATISEGGVCANVSCCQEKGFDGCWECNELEKCGKGYYSNTNEYMAKASAMFIRRYGKEKYIPMMERAEANGIREAEDWNKEGNCEKVLELMERFL